MSNQENKCIKLQTDYQKLAQAKQEFDVLFAEVKKEKVTINIINQIKPKIKTAMIKKQELKDRLRAVKLIINPFEKLMNFNEQYEAQKYILLELGDLEKLSNGQLGIKGIDPAEPMDSTQTKEYIFPSREAILKALLTKKEFYQLKMSQGFTRLLITPFALPLETLANKYGEELIRSYKANGNKLYSAGPDPQPHDDLSQLATLDLDINEPIHVHVEHIFKQADINGNLKYYPKQFEQNNHGCQTKAEILTNPLVGFEVTLTPKNPIISKDTAGKSANECLALTQTKDQASIYYGTRGQTPEGAIHLHRQTLYQTKQVLGDYCGNDKFNYCVGAYLDSSGLVPYLCWNCVDRQSFLAGYDPGCRNSDDGFCSVVRVSL